ncbi:MAG: hypothetical protein J5632_01290 [Bacteroidales bacterium]|nr:hypothetical protein [Bacteroidales bacterium]
MQNKLQELTEKLYNEGLAKGKEEGELILSQAKKEAADTIEKAKTEAAAIVAKAEKDAQALRSKAESDIRMASAQSLQATKKDIENLVVAKLSGEKVAAALADVNFLKEIIRSVAEKFDASQGIALELPEKLRAELEPWVNGELAKALKGGLKAGFSKKIAGGFTIAPADGGWFVSFTQESFDALIAEYLRPVTKKLLFGE